MTDDIFAKCTTKDEFKNCCNRLYEEKLENVITVDMFNRLDTRSKLFLCNSIFASRYYTIINDILLFDMCYNLLKETSHIYTKYCLGALRTMISFCRNLPDFPIPSQDVWALVYMNLDVPFHGAREQCIILLETLIAKDDNFAYNLFDEVLNFWSWTNKFKYYILGIIFTNYGFYHIMRRHPSLERMFFLRGITIALRYKHLMSASQALVKTLLNQDVNEFNYIIADVFRKGNPYEFENCLNQWMIHLKETDELFDILGFGDIVFAELIELVYLKADNFCRLGCLRNILRCSFEQQFDDVVQLDEFLLANIGAATAFTKQHFLEIFLNKIVKCKDRDRMDLKPIQLLIAKTYLTDCPSLRNIILKKLSVLFDYLAKSYFTVTENNRNQILDFFRFLKTDIYTKGIITHGNYQLVIFSLKMYELLIRLFAGGVTARLNKSTNRSINEKFRQVLVDHQIWLFAACDEYDNLIELVNNEFDDVREMAIQILIEYFIQRDGFDSIRTATSRTKQLKCLELLGASDAEYGSLANLYCRLYVACAKHNTDEDSIVEFVNDLDNRFNKNVLNFVDDPLAASISGQHLFPFLNCLDEIYRAECKMSGEYSRQLIALIERVSLSMLGLLNTAGRLENLEAPDFEMMDKGLQILIEESKASRHHRTDDEHERKRLLLAIWLTLKACGDLATTIGIHLLKTESDKQDDLCQITQQCLDINIMNLVRCRHKGVIEAAGLSFGRFIDYITVTFDENHPIYRLLYGCFPILFENVKSVSTTRRGAGFSIMMHHLIKNDKHNDRPLLRYTMELLMNETRMNEMTLNDIPSVVDNCDNLEASILHYLCVLVKDSSLREDIMPWMERIMIMTFDKITSCEWKIRNAALQLFGSIIPKLLGQRQYYDEVTIEWEPIHITIDEIIIKMPALNEYILRNLREHQNNFKSTSLIILFLEFLSKTEVRKVAFNNTAMIFEYNRIFWNLLRHPCEKIRILAAKCLALFHEFRLNIPVALDNIISVIFHTDNDENFTFGLLHTIIFMLKKYSNEIQFVEVNSRRLVYEQTRQLIRESYKFPRKNWSFYLRFHLLDLFKYLDFKMDEQFIVEIIFLKENLQRNECVELIAKLNDTEMRTNFGYDFWLKRVQEIFHTKN